MRGRVDGIVLTQHGGRRHAGAEALFWLLSVSQRSHRVRARMRKVVRRLREREEGVPGIHRSGADERTREIQMDHPNNTHTSGIKLKKFS